MHVNDLLLNQDKGLVTIPANATVAKVVTVLNENDIGAVPVCDPSGNLVGIISERDIVRGLAENINGLNGLTVADLMTSNVVKCTSDEDVNDIMAVMDKRHIRHIPVMEGQRPVAVVSSRDVMAAVLLETKNHCKTLGLAYEMVR